MIEIRLIVLVIIIAAIYILSKTTRVRKWICISKGNILSEWTRVKIRMEQRWIKRCLFIFRVAIEMVVIWWVFVWRGGVIYNRVKDILIMCQGKIEGRINTVQTDPDIILQALVYISPFGRELAKTENMRYVLYWGTACTIIGLIAFLIISWTLTKNHLFGCTILSVLLAFAMWYICYGMGMFIIKIPVYYNVLAAIAIIIENLIVGFILGIVLAVIVDEYL